MYPSLPMPTVMARIRKPNHIRKRSILAVCGLLFAFCLIFGISSIAVHEAKTWPSEPIESTRLIPLPEFELVKRQFQGGGLIGEIPADPVVSALSPGLPAQPDVTALSDRLLPVDSQGSNDGGVIGDVTDAASSILGGLVPTPVLEPVATAIEPLESTVDGVVSQIIGTSGATDALPEILTPIVTPVAQTSTPGGMFQDGVSAVDSILNGVTPPGPIAITPGTAAPFDPSISVTLPPLATSVGTLIDSAGVVDGLTSQARSILSDGTALPASPTLPLSPTLESQKLPSASLPQDGALPSADSALPGLDDILSDEGNSEVDGGALLSGLSNIVDQISGVDPEAAGDLTDALAGALPKDVSDTAGAIPDIQDAVDSGSSEALDRVIPSLGDALGEDIIPAAPIDTSDTPGALGNVVNRGKTIINQINEAMGDNIDPALQEVIDNVSGIVESAEEQLADPMCLVRQVVNGVNDQILVPCAEAGPDATTTIAHLAPTQYEAPTQSQVPAQTENPSPQPGIPSSENTQDGSNPSQGSSSGSFPAPEPLDQGGNVGSWPSEDSTQTQPVPQSSVIPGSQPGAGDGNVNSGEQPSTPGSGDGNVIPDEEPWAPNSTSDPSEFVPGSSQGGSGPGSESTPSEGGVDVGEQAPSSGEQPETPQPPSNVDSGVRPGPGSDGQPTGQDTSPGVPSVPSQGDQGQPWGYPASNGGNAQGSELSSGGSNPTEGSSIPGSGSSPGTPATPTTPNSPDSAAPVFSPDDGCPICPQCMPQSCDGDYGFDVDQSPCEGRGFECEDCLHGWFCPPRETPAQPAPCGLGWPCYHCSDGWFCVPDEDDSLDFVTSSNTNSGVAARPPAYGGESQTKRQGGEPAQGEDDDVNDYYSLGCFQDSTSRTLLGGVPVDYLSGRMSTSICVNHCIERGYTFAGIENGQECWCGETMRPDVRRLPETSCQTPCHGNRGSICGGNMAISIFADQDEYLDSVHR